MTRPAVPPDSSRTCSTDDAPATGDSLRATSQPPSQLAHDLGNFLAGLQMLVKGLRQTVAEETTAGRQLTLIEENANHAAEICRQLREALSAEWRCEQTTIGVSPHLEPVNLSSFAASVQTLGAALIPAGVSIRTELSTALPSIAANPTQLQQVVLDLLTNSVAAIDSGGGSITVHTGLWNQKRQTEEEASRRAAVPTVRWSGNNGFDKLADRQWIFLEVADTGRGIAEEDLQQIFEPMFTTKKNGSGLGLASVRQIVSSLGGKIIVESRLDQGTKVCCIFPCQSN